jgi:hypothetical protein
VYPVGSTGLVVGEHLALGYGSRGVARDAREVPPKSAKTLVKNVSRKAAFRRCQQSAAKALFFYSLTLIPAQKKSTRP